MLIATKDVQTLDNRGVTLMGEESEQYLTAPRYEEKLYPHLRKLNA